MKIGIGFGVIVAGIIIIASCSRTGEEEPFARNDVALEVYARIGNPEYSKSNTRAAGNSWYAGDKIGIYAYKGASIVEGIYNNYANVPYITESGNGIFSVVPQTNPIVFPKDGSDINFSAYYPHGLSIDAEHTIALDITNQQSPADIDFLFSSAGGYNKDNPHVSLQFKHVLSRFIVVLSPAHESISIEGAIVTLGNIYTGGRFSLVSGAIDALNTSQATSTITPFIEATGEGSQLKTSAILLPGQPLEDIAVTITLKDGTKYRWSPADSDPMLSSYQYSYLLQLDTDGRVRLLPENSTINPWDAGHNENVYIPPSNPKPGIVHAGYMEIPVYSNGWEDPDTYQVTHTISNRNWLGSSNAIFPVRNYTIHYDKNKRYPKWIAYPLHPAYMASGNRTNDWDWDPLIPREYQPNLSSGWSNNSYSRGHMLPSASRSATRDLNRTTFYYTNMAAQETYMNNGVWNELEQKVRVWAEQSAYDTLYVVTGIILPAPPKTVQYTNDNSGKRSAVPEYMYKALLRKHKSTGNYNSIAYKMENNRNASKYQNNVVSVKQLEEETGFTFFPMLPPEIADQVKGQTSTTYWN